MAIDNRYDGVKARRLRRGSVDRFWRAELRGDDLTVTEGDLNQPASVRTSFFPGAGAYGRLGQLAQKENEGYERITEKALDALLRRKKIVLPPPSPAAKKTPAKEKEVAGSSPKPEANLKRVKPKHGGPFAAALTGPVYHRPIFKPAKKLRRAKSARSTSGGRPIMAEGQPWPICSHCDRKLALYAQFDVEARFQLAFKTGSHVLLFHCPNTSATLLVPDDSRLPAEWLDPDFKSPFRLIVNSPKTREVVHDEDPVMVPQTLTFVAGKEVVTKNLDGPVGVDGTKIGGLPHWVQPPDYPTCACGAPMAFLMQVPIMAQPDWKDKGSRGLAFAGNMNAFLFFCSAQSSPYAGMMIVQR